MSIVTEENTISMEEALDFVEKVPEFYDLLERDHQKLWHKLICYIGFDYPEPYSEKIESQDNIPEESYIDLRRGKEIYELLKKLMIAFKEILNRIQNFETILLKYGTEEQTAKNVIENTYGEYPISGLDIIFGEELKSLSKSINILEMYIKNCQELQEGNNLMRRCLYEHSLSDSSNIENNMLTLLENRKTTAKIIKDMHEVDYNIHDFLFIAELVEEELRRVIKFDTSGILEQFNIDEEIARKVVSEVTGLSEAEFKSQKINIMKKCLVILKESHIIKNSLNYI